MRCSKDSNQESSHHDSDAILKLMASKVLVTRPIIYIRIKLNNLFLVLWNWQIFILKTLNNTIQK